MKSEAEYKKVVVIGGGFAGIEVARLLSKDTQAHVTLVSSNPSFQYYPNLYRLVVGATVNQVSIPLTNILSKNTTLIIDTYISIDPTQKTIALKSGTMLSYDYVVLALGSEPNYFGIDGMEAHSKSFLSVEKALSLKAHLLQLVTDAKGKSSDEAKKLLHTIIVGAGPSGTELAGALGPFLTAEAKKVGVDPKLISIDLLDSAPRVLAAIPENGSQLVTAQLKKNGVTVYSNYGVNACDGDCITVTDRTVATTPSESTLLRLEASTVIWTAGTKINSAYASIPGVIMTDKKRVQVTPTLTLPTDDAVYIAGDGAGTLYSGLAQTAIDQGQYVATSISQRIYGQSVSDYVPKEGTFVIPIGKYWAILAHKEFVVSGLAAFIIRIIVDARYFLSITSIGHVISMLKKDKTS
ncbi:MAG: FAD-dependent oxidoreductase [Candidatus Paceibacterota bacterium]